jgi:hypothetical protein
MRILKRESARISGQSKAFKKARRLPVRIMLEGLESRWFLSMTPPPLPVIPTGAGHLFVVTAAPFNAVGNGTTDNTAAIQSAINACSAAGGGIVEIPAAAEPYESQPLTMASNVDLQVDSGAELQAFGQTKLESAPNGFIYCNNISNFEITGTGSGAAQGIIDGNGGTWWPSTSGPNMFKLSGVSTVLFQNITITNSPHEHIACGNSVNNDVTIDGITINTPSTTPNTDGIDPAGINWLIENCNISDGDDDIAVKPANQPCANIDVESCNIGYGHGISVGGQTNATLNNMTVNNCTFFGTTMGLRLKGGPTNGGAVNNVSYANITMTNVKIPFEIDSWYNGGDNIPQTPSQAQLAGSNIPTWNNISYNNVTATWNSSLPSYNSTNYANSIAGELWGLPSAPLNNISFTDVRIGAFNAQEVAPLTGMQIVHARNVTFDSTSSITVVNGPDIISDPPNGSFPAGFPTPADDVITEAGFTQTDIGGPTTVPALTSWSVYDPTTGNWTIDGDGAGFNIESGDTSTDQVNFVSTSVSGDQTVIAKLISLTNNNSGDSPEAGVMYRAGTNPGDVFASIAQSSNNTAIFRYRTTTDGLVSSIPISLPLGGEYLEISRSSSLFTAGYSSDGTHWTTLGTMTISAMPTVADAGLVATPWGNGLVETAVFSNVQIIPTTVAATITGRSIFYSDSSFNGDTSTASNNDLNAIATDKSALLPGGTATYSNMTNYSNGINGIIVDITNLPSGATVEPTDFQFATGDVNDTTTWTPLTVLPTVTMLTPSGGVTPVDLTWPDHTIENTWLQVTVLADADTGLAANDVFYFGNLVGKVPDTSSPEQVTAIDLVTIQNNIVGTATITNPYDINRDGSVDAEDLVFAQKNSFSAINLITPTGDGPAIVVNTTSAAAIPLTVTPNVTTITSAPATTSTSNTITDQILSISAQRLAAIKSRYRWFMN